MLFLEPEFILNVHTHDPDYLDSTDNDIILYNSEKESKMVKILFNRL